ncbi:MAG: hypothetical protein WKG07_43320 [Hymenobacter sp.]
MVLPNGFDEADFQGGFSTPADCLRLTHTGTITAGYRIDTLLRALADCAAAYPGAVAAALRGAGRCGRARAGGGGRAGRGYRIPTLRTAPRNQSITY